MQENYKFKAHLGYIARLCLKIQKQKQKQKNPKQKNPQRTPIAQQIRESIDKWDCIKVKSSA
jgi:hypothetical protein